MSDEREWTVTIFDRKRRQVNRVFGLKRGQAAMLAEESRLPGGATYVHLTATKLNFKPYRRDPFATEKAKYWGVSNRKLSNKQIEAAAKRDPENATALLENRT